MQTHDDSQHRQELKERFMDRLEKRAAIGKRNKTSQITTGKDGEIPIASWSANGIHCQHLPDDEQGILRVSIGGGEGLPVSLDYCNIRGGVGPIIGLLQRTITALREAP